MSKQHNRGDMTGREFDRLTVRGLAERRYKKNGQSYRCWLCDCKCGNTVIVRTESLTCGNTRSCGCLRNEKTAERGRKQFQTHGMTNSTEFRIWSGILTRCFNTKDESYQRYGARGVTMCQRLRDSFEAFFEDMGDRPSQKHSVDRINTHGHYSCGKCDQCRENCWPMNMRWATPKEQMRNARNNRMVTLNGETRCVSEWAEILGIKINTVWTRIYQRGMTPKEALTAPIQFVARWHGQKA